MMMNTRRFIRLLKLLTVIAILLIAFGLRLIRLDERTLWYDEAFAILFAEQGVEAMLYGTLTPVDGGAADIHPLLYYATLNGWMGLVGQAVASVRLWSVLIGLLTIAMVYRLARDLFDFRTAVFATLITAAAPFHIQYSQEARMYSLMALLLVTATWCVIRGCRAYKFTPGWWIGFGVCAAGAMYTQQLSAFYLIALACVPLFARKRHALLGLIGGTALALVVYAPWLVQIPSQLAKVASYYWIPVPNAARPLLTLRSFYSVNLDLVGDVAWFVLAVALVVTLLLCVQLLIRRRRRTRTERQNIFITVMLFALPIALMWIVSQTRPVYLDRGLIASALMLYIALGWLFTRGGLPTPIALILVYLMFNTAQTARTHYEWTTFPNSPFDQLTDYVRDQWAANDVIVHQDKLSALPARFYARDLDQRYLGDAPGASDDTLALPTQQSLAWLADACIQWAARDANRIWWVMFSFAPAQYEAIGMTDLRDQLAWLDANYIRADERQFNDLTLILFSTPTAQAQNGECPA